MTTTDEAVKQLQEIRREASLNADEVAAIDTVLDALGDAKRQVEVLAVLLHTASDKLASADRRADTAEAGRDELRALLIREPGSIPYAGDGPAFMVDTGRLAAESKLARIASVLDEAEAGRGPTPLWLINHLRDILNDKGAD